MKRRSQKDEELKAKFLAEKGATVIASADVRHDAVARGWKELNAYMAGSRLAISPKNKSSNMMRSKNFEQNNLNGKIDREREMLK